MGYPLTEPDDYTGIIAISNNKYDNKDLENFIMSYEQEILENLLGCQMATDIVADLDGNNYPQEERYQKIWDKICIDDDCLYSFMFDYPYFYEIHPYYIVNRNTNLQWKSNGIIDLLKNQIYFYYTRDQQVKNTTTGNVKNDNSVSIMVANSAANMKRIYNKSIEWYNTIQWYICKNPDDYDYDSYKGVNKCYTTSAI